MKSRLYICIVQGMLLATLHCGQKAEKPVESLREIIKNRSYEEIVAKLQDHEYITDEANETPVHFATPYYNEKNRKLILLLKAMGADFNTKTSTCQNVPLHYASDIEAIRILVENGANPHAVACNNGNLLHYYVANENATVAGVKYIVEELKVQPFTFITNEGFCRPRQLTKNKGIISYLKKLEETSKDPLARKRAPGRCIAFQPDPLDRG